MLRRSWLVVASGFPRFFAQVKSKVITMGLLPRHSWGWNDWQTGDLGRVHRVYHSELLELLLRNAYSANWMQVSGQLTFQACKKLFHDFSRLGVRFAVDFRCWRARGNFRRHFRHFVPILLGVLAICAFFRGNLVRFISPQTAKGRARRHALSDDNCWRLSGGLPWSLFPCWPRRRRQARHFQALRRVPRRFGCAHPIRSTTRGWGAAGR